MLPLATTSRNLDFLHILHVTMNIRSSDTFYCITCCAFSLC
jgi:hypothetical protein